MDKQFDDNLEEQTETVIGPSAIIQGELTSQGSIKIEGQVIGKITSGQMIFITPSAKITAEVESESAVIGGEVQGHLNTSRRLVLLSTAKVAADITCVTLRIEDGALYTGKSIMDGNISAASGEKG